jgi:hypothetical protein
MHTVDILRYGHQHVMEMIEQVPDDAWEEPGVAGNWSAKDVIGHLGAFELMLGEVLASVEAGAPTAGLQEWISTDPEEMNTRQAALRAHLPARAVIDEYVHAHDHAMELARRVPADRFSAGGVIPWYGDEYDLDDFLVYTFYGHKREHLAQIGAHLDVRSRTTAAARR